MLKRKRTGLDDAMSVVTKFVNACNRHDADGVYACLHPDFDSIQPMYPSRNFRGADQVRRNWQAIFDAEPGFRLTVLRSAAADDTVWLELHGAGRDAEVAGVFVMGVQGDRIRWARIYSALVEPVPATADDGAAAAASAPLREVPRPAPSSPPAGEGELVEEALIAPVVDIERSGRRRRRSSRHGQEEQTNAVPPVEEGAEAPLPPVEEAASAEPETPVAAGVAADADAAPAPGEPEARVEPDVDIPPAPEPEVVAEPAAQEPEDGSPRAVSPEVGSEEAVSPRAGPAEAGSPEAVSPEAGSEEAVSPRAGPAEAVSAEAGPAEVGSSEPPSEPPPDPPRRRFGKKSR